MTIKRDIIAVYKHRPGGLPPVFRFRVLDVGPEAPPRVRSVRGRTRGHLGLTGAGR